LVVTDTQVKSGELNLPGLHLPYGKYEVALYEKANLIKTQSFTVK